MSKDSKAKELAVDFTKLSPEMKEKFSWYIHGMMDEKAKKDKKSA